MDQLSDGQLLAAWSRGETGAFEALVARHERALLRHARALLGDWRAGEDVVQEVLLRLAQRPPSLETSVRGDPRAESAVVSAWLHQVLRNLCMDTQRSEQRRRRREEAAAARDESSGGLDTIEAADTKAAVLRGLLRLPQDQREVLVLRLFDEKSYGGIATITGRKVGTVGWLISVGMKALAAELAPLVGGPGPGGGVVDERSPAMGRVQSVQGGAS